MRRGQILMSNTGLRSISMSPAGTVEKQPTGGLLIGSGHEFRNRLTGLSFAAEAVETELADGSIDRAYEFLHILQRGIRLANRQFSDLLLAQHLINQTIQPQRIQCRLRDVLADVLRHPDIRPFSHRLDIHLEPEATVWADEELLRPLLLHLIENALHFSPADAPVEIIADGGPCPSRIRILDRGEGIPENLLAHVGQPFASLARSGSKVGLGLGLFIVRSISEMLHARFLLLPREGGGSIADIAFAHS